MSRTPRTAWRHTDDTVDVVNFQSFNSYIASVMGVTTFSFSVNFGSYLRYIPPQWPPQKIKEGIPFPQEYECHFRGGLKRGITQPGIKDEYIWFVSENGRNLDWCINDVVKMIPIALEWFKQFHDRRKVLQLLTTGEQVMQELWGYGNNPSPIRSYLKGYVALSLNENDLANQNFLDAVESGCFSHLFSSIEGARYRAL